MNWLVSVLQKEARGRRFKPNDKVRFFTDPRKGTGNNIILTPNFQRGQVLNYKEDNRRYVVVNDSKEQFEVHPRNIMPDSFARPEPSTPEIQSPVQTPVL